MTVINCYESEMNRSISGEGKMINKGNIMVMTIKMALIFFYFIYPFTYNIHVDPWQNHIWFPLEFEIHVSFSNRIVF